MADVSSIQDAVLSVAMFIGGIYITRNYKKTDQTDKEVDELRTDHAAQSQKHSDLIERVVKVEAAHGATAKTVSENFIMQSQSLHTAITRAAETYARRDDLDKVLQKIDAMPDKMETRFRGILADRDAHKT